MPSPPRLLFLFSDTGGGHRSATEAVIEALRLQSGDSLQIDAVDFLKQYGPYPFHRLPDWYPNMVRQPRAWHLGYRLIDSPRRIRLLTRLTWPYIRRASLRLARQHPADLIICLHPIATDPGLRAIRRTYPANRRPPLIVIVTDLVSTHAYWYHPQADLTLLPTEPARHRALACGLNPEKLRVHGLPVSQKFSTPVGDPALTRPAACTALGWPADHPMILLVGGGDGMGPLEQTARAIAETLAASSLQAGLAIVTGRNSAVRQRLEAINWPMPTFIHGFVDNMPDLMRAASILVTKAGPGTISEALNTGLPMILYSHLPGQETGNIGYLTGHGAAIWAPTPGEVASALRGWLADPQGYAQALEACRRLARPDAARQVATAILAELNKVRIEA